MLVRARALHYGPTLLFLKHQVVVGRGLDDAISLAAHALPARQLSRLREELEPLATGHSPHGRMFFKVLLQALRRLHCVEMFHHLGSDTFVINK